MKHCVYIFSLDPLLNKSRIKNFESFNEENTVLLNKALLTNYIELLQPAKIYDKIFIFSADDEEAVSEQLNLDGAKKSFIDTTEEEKIFKKLNDKFFSNYSNNLLLFYNSIGIKQSEITNAFNFLDMEDETFLIGRAANNNASFIGFNNYNPELFSDINWKHLDFDQVLFSACKHENFVHIMKNSFLCINSINDFRHLYAELSKKESLAYCSQNVHEQFTHLFIEYKDLLK